jgi:crotonobetainyl-CoA:carnitine CoA-transferase CaiB-like acyl-CoA transferase
MALAYGIAGALFRRAATGEPSVVENSLLSTAAWVLSGDLTQAQLPQYQTHPKVRPISPLMYSYTTRDAKMVQLMILNPEPRWEAVCKTLGLDELIDDPRFATQDARMENAQALIGLMQDKFSLRDYAEWKPLLEAIDIPWELISSIEDVVNDPQVEANHMMQKMQVGDQEIDIVSGPTAFDGEPILGTPHSAPELGADTEELLREVGYDDQAIAGMRERAVAK